MTDLHKILDGAKTLSDLDAIKSSLLGKKSALMQSFSELKNLDEDNKKLKAASLNKQKLEIETLIKAKKDAIINAQILQALNADRIDASLFKSAGYKNMGHPISYTKDRIIEYFRNLDYDLCFGPLVEDDFHNFSALNIPESHPARDMQDTFYFNDGALLRTHTSPVQIRSMLSQKPPLKLISPGAVFRRDYDLTHTPMFHQVEGLVVDVIDNDKATNFANLKYTLNDFLNYMFGNVKVRFRASFFPFTEPSAEVDISCIFCNQKGCKVCKNSGWIEVLGCGMVDLRVFEAVNYENVSGYAFGMGVERLAMLTCGVEDLRSFFEADLRAIF
ncbi:MAG: phenylalanine--tRNA ligase subunit alpha [Helicobacter sp.]|nr:phenylalanine--tRNA ligase subunit alpha [Helicobacter sp.]